jgi:hypothetical protein
MTSIDASQAGANAEVQPGDRPPLIDGATDYTSLTDSVCRIPEWEKTPKAWYVAFTFSLMLLGILGAMIGYLIFTGVGVWGNNSPVFWGWPIVNFVFWVGIGHAGTLISAILYPVPAEVAHQREPLRGGHDDLRGHVRRHLPGDPHRPRLARLLALPAAQPDGDVAELPQPAALGRVRGLDLRHGLDALLVLGMMPDFATLRDRAKSKVKRLAYGIFSLGMDRLYPAVAPLRAGVPAAGRARDAAGALRSLGRVFRLRGLAAARLAHDDLPAVLRRRRHLLGLCDGGHAHGPGAQDLRPRAIIITIRHLENMNKVILATGMMVGYAYAIEFFIAWYGGNPYESFRLRQPCIWPLRLGLLDDGELQRASLPQLFWFKKARTTCLGCCSSSRSSTSACGSSASSSR